MRSGWKACLVGGAAGLAVAVAAAGCGESKEPTKAQTDSKLTPLPSPSAPGGSTVSPEGAKKGAKTAAGSTAGSQ